MEIITLPVGQLQTNAYLLADPASRDAAVIDPGGEGQRILAEADERGWRIAHLWYTHAHFDHIGGAGAIADALNPLPLVALHPADHVLWRVQGGAPVFGMSIDPGPEPSIDFADGMTMKLGETVLEVRHTPGHTPGHCVIYCAQEKTCFCGDLIFQQSVGRTDLPGGDWQDLLESIHTRILTLPDETRLLPGHGPATTVGEEKMHNPFLSL
jgi:glyoxylase-like metal-dependent hydrolase (beta-lactamase superfamily II)